MRPLSFAPSVAEAMVDYDASTVLARVNEREITLGHMIALMERLPEQYQTLPDAQLFPGILDQFAFVQRSCGCHDREGR